MNHDSDDDFLYDDFPEDDVARVSISINQIYQNLQNIEISYQEKFQPLDDEIHRNR